MINRNLTNAELLAIDAVKNNYDENLLTIIDKVETANPDYVNIYILGKVNFGIGTMSEAEADMLGINFERPMRAIITTTKEMANDLIIGGAFYPNMAIRVEDSYEKFFEEQQPRVTAKKEILVGEDNKPIYRTTKVVYDHELVKNPHRLIKPLGIFEEPKVTANSLIES